jgi:glutamate synthase (NADPH/NADH) small chain
VVAIPALTASALQFGKVESLQIEIMPRLPMERAEDNPWPEWPKVYKMDYGQEEAAARFGADPRVYQTTVKKFIADANGAIKELITVQIKWEKNDKGQFIPVEQAGTEQTLPAQLVLLAMGFLGPEQPLVKALSVDTDPRSNIKAEHGKFNTSPGVFRRVTAVVARVWWYGPSTKVVARRANAIAI